MTLTAAPDQDQVPSEVLWTPADRRRPTALEGFLARLTRDHDLSFDDYDAFLAWSIEQHDVFWSRLWDWGGLPGVGHVALRPEQRDQVFKPRWFPGAELNYAEWMLAMPGLADGDPALLGYSDSRPDTTLTAAGLRDLVGRIQAGLRAAGVGRGDRVAAYLPNIPETVALLVATAGLGAVFTSCAPEFGVQSVIDRWRQIEPKVVVAIDGYRYGAKAVARHEEVASIVASLPSVGHLVVLPYLSGAPAVEGATQTWAELTASPTEPTTERVSFDHPLYILFSSGTTGLPKAIMHGHGGITLEHLKSLSFAHDVHSRDRVFWQTTTGWMMWNLVVSGLGLGATVVTSDVNPTAPDVGALWRIADRAGITHFGTSPGFLQLCRKAGFVPREQVDTSAILQLGVTGTACPGDLAAWACASISDDVRLMSGSGGTDICSGFVGDSPSQDVRTGRMASAYPGVAVSAYAPDGTELVGEQGELVITKPMPSMPVGFWGDEGDARYRDAYFDDFAGVWRHGDWITFWPDGSCAIYGRSDATLNRDGVRLGTAEYYELLDAMPGVEDALVVHAERSPGEGGKLLLFVVLTEGTSMDEDLLGRIRDAIKTRLSPRHLPDEVLAIRDVPRNLTGKRLEVPVKKILEGAAVTDVATSGAMQNPGSLDQFTAFAVRS
ncbi:acetoacetate--CoA ligase [Nocardioides carbamazepini]|uniref:acetoacetate--CoA ligase n=1 Tax=Nocardioides carbamazepini TaxID=2854259 RepID=UPI00214A3BAB|nr:acetoacetate--CoA ligase [Nocardioides carbamazepini]MCR1782453.1 acetoacetate--CoA ligase [Nocardioides carbamazepini]